jgi:hypothetical protein
MAVSENVTGEPIDVDATVRSLAPGGYVDRFETGGYARYDTVTLDLSRPGPGVLTVILDGLVAVDWRPGVPVRFRIGQRVLAAGVPVFLSVLLDLAQRDEGHRGPPGDPPL